MENNPAGLYKTDTLKDCFKRADELSSPDGSRHTGMMCDRKDLRRIVLLVKTVRDLQMKLRGEVENAKQSESNFAIPVVSNSLVADIRNKLTPPKNLCAMIKALPRHILEDTQFEDLIMREVEQTEKSIDYLSNL